MKSLISVIIPIYNNEKYISKCLDSILSQNYTNIQVIAIDDGSTDKSGEILEQYAAKDVRIKAYHTKNCGVSAARNTGIKHAVGEYVTFVDSDDTIDPNMYEYMLGQFVENDIDIVHCGYKKIKLDGTSRLVCGTNKEYHFNKKEGVSHLIKGDLFTGALWNKIYRRSLLDHIYFDESIKINEDILFNFYAFQRAKKTIFIDQPFYHYYERENASTKRTNQLKKVKDCALVAKNVFMNSKGKSYGTIACSKYIISLMNYYRELLYENIKKTSDERKKLRYLLNELLKNENEVSQKYIINYQIMIKWPRIYKVLYRVYNKIRKPNWDI